MKNLTFKSIVHVLVLSAILITAVIISTQTYKSLKQVCTSQPVGTGTTCFFDMID